MGELQAGSCWVSSQGLDPGQPNDVPSSNFLPCQESPRYSTKLLLPVGLAAPRGGPEGTDMPVLSRKGLVGSVMPHGVG